MTNYSIKYVSPSRKEKSAQLPQSLLASKYITLSSFNSNLIQGDNKALTYNFGQNGLAASGGKLILYEEQEPIDEVCWGAVECENHYEKFLMQSDKNQTLVRPAFYEGIADSVSDDNSTDFVFAFYEPDLIGNPTILNAIKTQEQEEKVESSVASQKDNLVNTSEKSDQKGSKQNQKTCPVGKYLNPLTNRCKKIQISAKQRMTAAVKRAVTTKVCPAGKHLNPATNRCKNDTDTQNASSAIVKPCKAGYERNPDTNRCRKVVSATNQLKPCKDGYERNPDTNRCRKIKPINNSAEYPVENSYNQSVKPANLAAFSTFGAATIAATAYTGYQFRHRIRKIITKILSGYQ